MKKNLGSKSGISLNVRQRLEAAFLVHTSNNPGVGISIVELCRQAAVSRATLYAHHPDLLEKIKQLGSFTAKVASPKVRRTNEAAHLQRTIKALRYICVELNLELRRQSQQNELLRAEIKSLRSKNK
ncbi:hypothetical protein [uncultured Oxalicibacterium sp.]|uniref:hypothetical protein n=1 Tax=uncultured Oxalicibacterium sp. TaxID=1168540 RepID=UPI0025E689BC|nr:hypothetical protein [uncultured Oxalicibacterium sp.]